MDLTSHSQKSNESLYKKKMTELETERDVLEERFAFGKINEEMFRKFQSKIEAEISKLRERMEVHRSKYLTDKVNSLFRLIVVLSMSFEGGKENSPLKTARNPIQYT
jgi:hypothetical protein